MKKIVIESMFLFDYNYPDKGVTVGGTQRYTLDLGELFCKLGYEVIYVTKSIKKFEMDYNGWAKIVSFNSPYGTKGQFSFSKKVFEFCQIEKPDIVCYSDLEIGWPYCYKNSFALQHGIGWDTPYEKGKRIKRFMLKRALFRYDKIICVDTNFINWCRERYKKYFDNKDMLCYIPNYVDLSKLDSDISSYEAEDEKILFFPRRLVAHRGADLFMNVLRELKSKGYSVKGLLAIQEFRNEEFKEKYPDYVDVGVEIINPELDDIYKYYKKAYLTIIPTIWSEGTSLSAIESICSGIPVVVSDVGGLGNIVIPDFNGFICAPTKKQFTKALETILCDVTFRNKMATNCLALRNSFSKERWENQIVRYLEVDNTEKKKSNDY